DGKVRRGHLSYAMHLYGTPDGRGESPLYVPAGFASHSGEPTPTDAAVTFYYPKLGNLTDVTLAVFHVADFQITSEGDRVRIGNLGGPGGSSALYKHSHIEFYKGNVGLPAAAAVRKACGFPTFPKKKAARLSLAAIHLLSAAGKASLTALGCGRAATTHSLQISSSRS